MTGPWPLHPKRGIELTWVTFKVDSIPSHQSVLFFFKGERADAKTDGENILAAMKALTSAAGTLHSNCDFLVKNFQTRQTAMDDEIGGLIEAKAVMQGITGAANSESWVLFRTGDVKVDRVDGHTRKSIETICRHRKPGLQDRRWERMRLRCRTKELGCWPLLDSWGWQKLQNHMS